MTSPIGYVSVTTERLRALCEDALRSIEVDSIADHQAVGRELAAHEKKSWLARFLDADPLLGYGGRVSARKHDERIIVDLLRAVDAGDVLVDLKVYAMLTERAGKVP